MSSPKSQTRAQSVAPDDATILRRSDRRRQRLRDTVDAWIPHLNDQVHVVISEKVPTACVTEARPEALNSDVLSDIQRERFKQLLEHVDEDYLMWITARPTPLNGLPDFLDQKGADKAYQYGLAFHEVLHVLKTATIGVHDLIQDNVAEEHVDRVSELFNIVSDGAIEHEALTGSNFSDNIKVRLGVARKATEVTVEDRLSDIPADQYQVGVWEAVELALREYCIRRNIEQAFSGQLLGRSLFDSLRDPDDDRVVFVSEADEKVYQAVNPALEELACDTKAIRSADRDDYRHRHEKAASIKRAKRLLETWEQFLLPLVDPDEFEDRVDDDSLTVPEEEQNGEEQQGSDPGDGQSGGGSQSTESGDSDNGNREQTGGKEEADADPEACPECGQDDFESEHGRRVHYGREHGDTDDLDSAEDGEADNSPESGAVGSEGEEDQSLEDIEQQDLDIESGDLDTQRGDALDQPSIGEEPDPSEVDIDANPSQDGDSETEQETVASSGADQSGQEGGVGGQEEQSAGESNASGSECGGDDGDQNQSQAYQLAVSSGLGNTEQQPDESSEDESCGEEQADSDGDENREEVGGEEDEQNPSEEQDSESPDPDSTGESSQGGDTQDDLSEIEIPLDPLEDDQQQAEQDARDLGIDPDELGEELGQLEEGDDKDGGDESGGSQNDGGGDSGSAEDTGSGSGDGAIDDLEVMPDPESGQRDRLAPGEWDDICDEADRVAETLEKVLRLERQGAARRGQTSGSLDTGQAYRLSMNDTRSFRRDIPGEEKEYALVLVLDRSGSMGHGTPAKIDIATEALAQFGIAAEDLGVDVAIIDFVQEEARLIKPFSVDLDHVRGTIMENRVGGGTPLSDALELAIDLVEERADEPLIVSVTDDKPADVDAVKSLVQGTRVPVCSLTVATDCKRGSPPEKAKKLAPVYERTDTVFDQQNLNRALDRFAGLMTGL